jgi:hypothetical protein
MSLCKELYMALRNEPDYRPQKYSGRSMYGKQCFAVSLESERDLWNLACSLTETELYPGAPRTDSLGFGIVAYWPNIPWEEPEAEDVPEEERVQ